jgi:hypothetical protein
VVALETQAICQKTAGKRPKITSNGRLRLAYTCAVVCGCLPRFALPPPALALPGRALWSPKLPFSTIWLSLQRGRRH